MLSFKKIVIGMGLLGALATSGFCGDLNVDKNFCEAYNYATYQDIYNDVCRGHYCDEGLRRRILKESGDKIFTRDVGTLSTDFLKENGIGYSVSLNWGNIVLAFDDYLRYANSKEDQRELSKFLMIVKIFKIENSDISYLVKDGKSVFSYREIKAMFEHKDDRKSISSLTSEFILTSREKKAKEIYGTFSKYVINGDFERARAYIKKVNAKSGINEAYKQFENICEK